MKAGSDFSTTFAIYGDLGNVNGQSTGLLQKMAETRQFDFVVHAGDFAYDMHDVSIVGFSLACAGECSGDITRRKHC
jgi:hypothetical protein